MRQAPCSLGARRIAFMRRGNHAPGPVFIGLAHDWDATRLHPFMSCAFSCARLAGASYVIQPDASAAYLRPVLSFGRRVPF